MGWPDIVSKWLELLRESVPQLSTVAVIANPRTPMFHLVKDIQVFAPEHGLNVRVEEVREPAALDRAFKEAGQKAQGVLVLPDPMIAAYRAKVAALAAKHRLPAVFFDRTFVEAGGLIAYGPDTTLMFHRAAEYVDKILKGAKPADLPIELPTQWSLAVNLKTARALGLTIPESILLRANEVIR
jgi:putative ABC transport system substrate-binding protein